jgi:sulfur carrier protein
MKAQVNGVEREVPDGATIADVLAVLNAPTSGVAVALDGEVVPRAMFAETTLAEGAVLEVLTAVQGG